MDLSERNIRPYKRKTEQTRRDEVGRGQNKKNPPEEEMVLKSFFFLKGREEEWENEEDESSHLSSQCCHVQLSGHVVETSNLIEFQSQEKELGKKGVDNFLLHFLFSIHCSF